MVSEPDSDHEHSLHSSPAEKNSTAFSSRLRGFEYVAQESCASDNGSKKRSLISEQGDAESHQARKKPKSCTQRTDNHEYASPEPLAPGTSSGKDRRIPAPKAVASPSSGLKRFKSSGYAPPSQYAHLPHLTDVLAPDLLILFIGLNPGVTTAEKGHAYAHPSNRFWPLLHMSGITPARYPPSNDVEMPRLCACGFTNIVARPTSTQAQLSRAEMVAGTPTLEQKARKWKPEAVCIVGKGIWEAVFEYRHGRKPKKDEFRYGWQDENEKMGKLSDNNKQAAQWNGAWVFVAASTSGASASLRPEEKEAIWRPLGEWVQKRRRERTEKEGFKTEETSEAPENE